VEKYQQTVIISNIGAYIIVLCKCVCTSMNAEYLMDYSWV